MEMQANTYITIQSWMRQDLDLSGTELLVYAIIYGFSQDGESRFRGSRQYLADWCGCTVRSIQTILNSLTESGLVTKYETTLNNVKHCEYVANFTTGEKISRASEKSSRASEKSSLNNIEDNIEDSIIPINRNDINKSADKSDYESHSYSKEDMRDDFLGSAKKKQPKKRVSLYDKCVDEVYLYTKNLELQDLLIQYLSIRLSIKEKPLYGVNQWTGLLNHLSDVSGETALDKSIKKRVDIVKQSIEKGWCSFYPLKSNIAKSSPDSFKPISDDICSEYGGVFADKDKGREEKIITDVKF